MALGHLGVLKEFVSVNTDRTKEAQACRIFYGQTVNEVLGDFPWSFATRIDDLILDSTDPDTEWRFQYEYPVDALRILQPFSGIRPESGATQVPYRIITDGTDKFILTNLEDAPIEYVERVTDVARFPADFVQCLALKLAAYIAPTVTGGDQFKLGARALNLYAIQFSIATANSANQERASQPADSEFITVRQ